MGARTDRLHRGVARRLTLDLAAWEDLPLIEAADALYVLATDAPARDAERQRLFARGLALLRAEQPDRVATLADEVLAFQRRLAVTRADASVWHSLPAVDVLRFVLAPSGPGARVAARRAGRGGLRASGVRRQAGPEALPDRAGHGGHREAARALALGPLDVAALAVAVGVWLGAWWGVGLAVGAFPLALFTRRSVVRRAEAIRDARLFFVLGDRSARKQQLLAEAQGLAARVTALADEVLPRLTS